MKQFDIAKYLRENYEGPFKTFQSYADLKPLKEEMNEMKFEDAIVPIKQTMKSLGYQGEYDPTIEEGYVFTKNFANGVIEILITNVMEDEEQFTFTAVYFNEITKSQFFGLVKKKVIDYRNGKWVSKDGNVEIVDLGKGMFSLDKPGVENLIKSMVKKVEQKALDIDGIQEDEDLGQQEAMPEPYEGDGHPIDGLGGELDRDMDVSMNEEDVEEEMHFNDEIAMLSQEYIKWLEQNNLPKMSADELLADLSIEKTDEQKAWLQTFIDRWEDAMDADNIDEEVSVSSSGVEMEEGWSEEQDKYDRMMGLSHEYFEKVSPIVRYTIDKLRADGFNDQDILDFMATDFS